MSITQCMTTSFKVDCLGIVSNAKIALYSIANGAALDATTTAYTITGEVVGTGYTATGKTLTVSQAPSSSGTPSTTAFMNFADISWGPGASFSADGALIYNAITGHSIAVLSFGGTKTVAASIFTIQFPVAGTGSAIVQIA